MSVSTEVQRTLVKSPPELWTELSNPEALARHLGDFGEIRITTIEPETKVEWEAEEVRGVVQLKQSGWGTKVTLSVTRTPGPGRGRAAPQSRSPGSRRCRAGADQPVAAVEPEPVAAQPDRSTPRSPSRSRRSRRSQAQSRAQRRRTGAAHHRVRADPTQRARDDITARGARAPTWLLCSPLP